MSILVNGYGKPIGFVNQAKNQPSLFPSNARVELRAENNMLVIITPYHADFVNDFKNQVPVKARKWDVNKKVWFAAPEYAETVRDLISFWFGQTLEIPELKSVTEHFETILETVYVANCATNTGFSNVYCWVNNNLGWNARIPESVLRKFFKNYSADQNSNTYYAMLGIDEQANQNEIKSAYRRAARQWHPDVCRDENAVEMFHKIKLAFDLLSNSEKKAAYDAGLFFERMSKGKVSTKPNKPNSFTSFTPILRCGYLQIKAHYEIGYIIVDEILSWNDITNEHGQTMVAQWNIDKPSIIWI